MVKELKENKENIKSRPPVVVILGHVDHGKCIAPSTAVPLVNGYIFSAREIWEKYKTKGEVKKYKNEGYVAKIKNTPQVFSFNGQTICKSRITHLWKLKAPKRMIEVKVSSGDRIEVTPEHPFFIFNSEGVIIQKRADLIEKGDFIVVPQNLTFSQNSIHKVKEYFIKKLERLDNFVVFLDKKKSARFLQRLKKANKQKLYRKGFFSTKPQKVALTTYQRFRVADFIKLAKYFRFTSFEIYEMIDSIKNATEKWRAGHTSNKISLPQLENDFRKLGYILGAFSGDGCLRDMLLTNNDKEIQSTYSRYMKEVFNLEVKVVQGSTCQMVKTNGGHTLRRFFTEIVGFPKKEKALKIDIPFVVLSSRPLLKGFIEGLFDTDGYASNINHNYSAEFTSKSKDLINSLSLALLGFGIHSLIYSKNGYHYLKISNNPYLKKFSQDFSFRHKQKRERVKSACYKSSTSRIFDLTPLSGQLLKSFYINEYLFPYFSKYRSYQFLSRSFIKKLLEFKNRINLPPIFLNPAVKNLINPGEISCVKVKEKKFIKNKYKFVYDFTVPKTHNFIAERIIVHNSSILEAIKDFKITEKESGGITQHIGAYEVEHEGKKITFIDTPGHEAFSAMRSRGAAVADIAILVVAAEEGVKPQTKEAILHIKKAGIPMIVAINKIDKPTADPERVKRELAQQDVLVESMGGKVPSVETSAKTKKGIAELLEIILLVAEMEGLKGDLTKKGEGVVIESYLDNKRGPVATLLLRDGVLKRGDVVATVSAMGKVKSLENFQGKSLKEALPSQPAVILGFEKTPQLGEKFMVFPAAEAAQAMIEKETKKERREVFFAPPDVKISNLILKVDVLGSLGPIEEMLKNLPQEKVILRILKAEVGDVNENDIKLAKSAKSRIVGFRVRVNSVARQLAERENLKIMNFDVIYELVQGVRKVMEKIVEPTITRVDLGKLKVLVVFITEKSRQIIGGRVVEGEVKKGLKIEIIREEQIIGGGKLVNLQKNKKDIEKAGRGEEVGILYEGGVRIEKGDTLVFYTEERRKEEL